MGLQSQQLLMSLEVQQRSWADRLQDQRSLIRLASSRFKTDNTTVYFTSLIFLLGVHKHGLHNRHHLCFNFEFLWTPLVFLLLLDGRQARVKFVVSTIQSRDV
jgi:hypothetical protein